MESVSFGDYFWGSKHQGYDVLYQNMITGGKTTKELMDYLKEMQTLEDYCFKNWGKLSKLLNVSSSGTLQPYWLLLREYSAKRCNVHGEFSQKIQYIRESLQRYIDEQQTKHKACKDSDVQTMHFNNLLLTTGVQLDRAKQAYHNRYLELHKLNKLEEATPGSKTRDIEKQESKLKKAVDEYKYQIEKYNNTCTKFKSKMQESCKNFQDIEQYHLVQMKSIVHQVISQMKICQSNLNNYLKDLENTDEKLTTDYLLGVFVKLRTTGQDLPSLVQFEDAEQKFGTSASALDLLADASPGTLDSAGASIGSTGDVATGNLVNLDLISGPSPLSGTEPSAPATGAATSATATATTTTTFQQVSSLNALDLLEDRNSENNSINNDVGAASTSAVVAAQLTPGNAKKQKKYNKIFRRKRSSPVNSGTLTGITKSVDDFDKEKTNSGEIMVDEEGYSIRPDDPWSGVRHYSSSNFSSDDEDDDNQDTLFKGIKINIRPHDKKTDSSHPVDNINMLATNSTTKDDLIKAVQAIKLPVSQNVGANSSSRSITPNIGTSSVVEEEQNVTTVRDSRRHRGTASGLKVESPLLTPKNRLTCPTSTSNQFKIDFDKTAGLAKGLDLKLTNETFETKFLNASSTCVELDPWNVGAFDDNDGDINKTVTVNSGVPPPLPAKVTNTPRSASVVPFSSTRDVYRPSSEMTRLNSGTTRIVPPIPNTDLISRRSSTPSIEGIPLAVAFTETFSAKFRHRHYGNGNLVVVSSAESAASVNAAAAGGGSSSTPTVSGSSNSSGPLEAHTCGRMVVSFPSSMIQHFDALGAERIAELGNVHFCLTRAERLRNVEPCQASVDFVKSIENPSDDNYLVNVELEGLCYKLKSQRSQQPGLPFFNVELVQYDVTNSVRENGLIQAPVSIHARWDLPDLSTAPLSTNTSSHLMINYSWQWPNTDVGSVTFRPLNGPLTPENQKSQLRGEVRFLVMADGKPGKMQSLPPCIWNSDLFRASWRYELVGPNNVDSVNSSSVAVNGNRANGCIKAKFCCLNADRLNPQPVACQFSVEGAIESGVGLQVKGSMFRISRHKYRLISGRYVWEPSPPHNYPSTLTSNCSSTASTLQPQSHNSSNLSATNSNSNSTTGFCV